MKKICSMLLFVLPALMAFTSCTSNNNDGPEPDSMFGAFATLTAVSSDGAAFQIQEEGVYSSPVTVVATWSNQKVEDYKVGSRYYIYYINGTTDRPFIPGEIGLYAVAPCANGSVERAPYSEIMPLATGTYNCNYKLTVTGMYVNAFVQGAANASRFGLFVDEATVDTEYPDVYLYLDSRAIVSGTGGTDYFGSFSFENLWENPDVKGIRVHYELGGNRAQLDINKTSLAPAN